MSQATDTLMLAASEGAGTISRQVTDLLDRQVSSGSDMISQVASSTRVAANDMEATMPQIAGLVRAAADRIDNYANDIKDRSVEQILARASDFTRRQPTAVFALATLAGFLAFRTIGNVPSQPAEGTNHSRRTDQYGS